MTIERASFQKLLFKIAFCLMACDGHIHELEIKELKSMVKNTPYFHGIDLSDEVDNMLGELKKRGRRLVAEILEALHQLTLSTVQELLILEVAFRLAHADEKLDENEVKFIRFLRSKLKVYDETIRDRFGAVEYLFDKNYANDIVKKTSRKELLDSFAMPDLEKVYDFIDKAPEAE